MPRNKLHHAEAAPLPPVSVTGGDQPNELARLKADLQAERMRVRLLELELVRAQGGTEVKLSKLADLLLEVLSSEDRTLKFNNPLLDAANAEQDRCWLLDPNCDRAPGMDQFGKRMEVCSACDAFKRCAPDTYTRVGELVNAILFQLEHRHEQFRTSQEQLIQSEKLAGLGELAAGLAHEINTPTGIILARLDVMELDAQYIPDELKEDIGVIRKHADRLRRLTGSLTSFARRHKIEKRPVFLQDLLRELLEITERLIHVGNVILVTKLPDEPMEVFGDGTLIQQVYMNLIINARDAMPAGGRLDISGWTEDGNCVLEFKDTGAGMDKATMKRIFDPFFTTKDTNGTGLGLSISYGIMKDHGGRIEVSSTLGHGTGFRLVFPMHQASVTMATM